MVHDPGIPQSYEPQTSGGCAPDERCMIGSTPICRAAISAPIKLWACNACVLFRSRRYLYRTKDFTCYCHYRRKTPSYTLDPFDEARFTKYRKAIWNQLQKSDVFFRDRFHEVLKCHPGLDPSEFLLRISIGVDPGGAYVTSVAVEGLNDTLRRNNPWEKEIFELQKKERMCPSYEGLGIIALEVMVHNPSGEVSFGMWMGLPLRALPEVALPEGALPEEALPEEVLLEEGELLPENEPPEEGEWSPLEEGIQSYYGLPTDWAYKIADSLSDRQPDYWNFPWLISRDLIRILNVRNPGWRQF